MNRTTHHDMLFFVAEELAVIIDILVLRVLRGIIIMEAC